MIRDELHPTIEVMAKRSAAANWSQCKSAIAKWPRPGLVALVQELYRLSAENRRYLHGRLLPQKSEATLKDAEKEIKEMVSTRTVFGRGISQRALKRLVDQFEKAVDDPALVARLLVVDIAESFNTFSQVGDYEPMVDHLYASMNRLEECLKICQPDAARGIINDLEQVAKQWGSEFGYGVSDELVGLFYDWREKLAGVNPDSM